MKKERKNVVILTAQEFEDVEVIYPYYRLVSDGFKVDIATEDGLDAKGKFGFPISALLKPDKPITIKDLRAIDYDIVVIPGGHVAPDKIRQMSEALNFIKEMHKNNKLIASICHGPWVLISAGVLSGRKATCYPSMIDDLTNAGAKYLDKPVVVDGNIITSRRPRDLPFFIEKLIHAFNSRYK